MPRYRCSRCGPAPRGFEFEREDLVGQCPRCNLAGMPWVYALVDVHLVVLDPKGPITGSFGRQYIACQPKREHLALQLGDDFSATEYPPAVTCPRCQRSREYRERAKLFAELQGALQGGMTIEGASSCCG